MNTKMIRSTGMTLLAAAVTAIGASHSANAQQNAENIPAWRFGAFGAMNYNLVGAGAQNLVGIGDTLFLQDRLGDGHGFGYYVGLMTEYIPGTIGFQLRASLDDRRATLKDQSDPNKTYQFSARLTYATIEPMLRVNLGSPNFHVVAGPSVSFVVTHKYDYLPGDNTSPSIADQTLANTVNPVFGVGGGLGYDWNINSKSAGSTRWYLTPFIEGSYLFNQKKTDFPDQNHGDSWATTTIRAGFQLKFGNVVAAPVEVVEVAEDVPTVDLAVRAPAAVTDERRVTEWFPLRNYLFFDPNSTQIPMKYAKLDQGQASNFSEKSLLDMPVAGASSVSSGDRSQRQMGVYYNAMNIYADRMRSNPSATITLVGSAPSDAEGLAMATSVRDYMVSTFGIDASRIAVKGQTRPPHASGTRATPKEDLDLVSEENRRVEVLSNNAEIMKPVQIETLQAEPIDNDLILNVRGTGPIQSWTVNVTGDGGYSQTFGPYRETSQRIDAKPLLQGRQSGRYTATVNAVTVNGRTVTRTTDFQLVRREAAPASGERFSVLFEYDESKTVQTYDDFLRTQVAPKIPSGSTVVIHGHTDKVGLDDYNFDLSSRRATETRNVLQDALTKLGRTATFDAYGFGESEARAPFTNTSAEGRYYNRTVLIEVIPNGQQ